MPRRTEGRLMKLERSAAATARSGWAAIDLEVLRDQVCAAFGISTEQLERELQHDAESSGYESPVVSAYWSGFGGQLRSAGLTFVDLVNLADQEVA